MVVDGQIGDSPTFFSRELGYLVWQYIKRFWESPVNPNQHNWMTDGFVQCSAGRISRPATWVIIPRIGSLTSTNWGGPNKRLVTKYHNSHPLYTSRLSRPQKTSFRSGFVHFWDPAWSYWIRGKWVSTAPCRSTPSSYMWRAKNPGASIPWRHSVPRYCSGRPSHSEKRERLGWFYSRGCHEWFVCGVLMCLIHWLYMQKTSTILLVTGCAWSSFISHVTRTWWPCTGRPAGDRRRTSRVELFLSQLRSLLK